jgi:hypothetical protein
MLCYPCSPKTAQLSACKQRYALNQASHQLACFWKLALTCSDWPVAASSAGKPAKKARWLQTAPGWLADAPAY